MQLFRYNVFKSNLHQHYFSAAGTATAAGDIVLFEASCIHAGVGRGKRSSLLLHFIVRAHTIVKNVYSMYWYARSASLRS